MDSVARTAKNGHTDILTLKRYYSVWRRRDPDIIIWIWYKFCTLLSDGPESKTRRFPQSGGGAFVGLNDRIAVDGLISDPAPRP